MMLVAPMMQLIILPLVANFDVKNINLVYHHLFIVGATHIHRYCFTADGYAHRYDGNDAPYGFLYRLYVPHREYAPYLSRNIQSLPLKLLLQYCEESNAQRVGFHLCMERNADINSNGSDILKPCNEEV